MSIKTIARSLVAACCAALGLEAFAWTGTLTADTPQKVLDGTSLGDLDNMSFSGRIGGSYMGGSTGKVFEHFFLEDVVGEGADAYRLCQMQINDYNHASDCHLKFVTVKFTMGEDGIYAVQTEQGYVQNMGPQLVGTKIADGQGYTVDRSVTIAQYVLKSLEVVTEIKINDGETMTLTAENKPGADAIVYVNAGGTLDLHGVSDTEFTLILNGGTLKNTGNGISNGTKSLAKGIIVRADSTIDTSSNFGTIAGGHALHNINLGNHTLTKTGANTLFLSNVEFNGAGTIKIEQGMVRIYNSSTNQYPDNDHPGHSMASSGLVVDVKIASGAKLECYGAPKFNSITGVSNESKGELYLFGAEGLKGIPGCFDVSKVILGGNKSTGYIGWNESAVELTINSTFEITQGSSNTSGTIKTLKGTGSITKTWSETPIIYVEDHSGFTGSVAEDIGVHLSIAKSETAYYYTIAQVKDAIATTDVTNISISDDDLAANGLKIVEGKIVAKSATELFVEAISAAADGATVTLTDDITLEARIDIAAAEKSITLDLGGYTITPTATCGNGSAFNIVSGTVTIKNGTIDGTAITTIECDPITVRSGAAVVCETLTISICSQTGACVYPFAGATATIKSGTYTNTTTEAYPYGSFTLTLNQANVADQLIFVEGGSFTTDPAKGDDVQLCKSFLASGYVSTLNEETGLYDVTEKTEPDRPSDIGDDDKSAYDAWATEHGVTGETSASLAVAFKMGVSATTTGMTPEQAVAAVEAAAVTKANELLKEVATTEGIDLAAVLKAGEFDAATVAAFEAAHPGLTIALVVAEEITAVEGESAFYKLELKLK